MAVESMKMMNVVAPVEFLDDIARDIVLLGNVHIVNALHEVDESNFSLPVAEENIEKLRELAFTKPHPGDTGFKDAAEKADALMRLFGIKPVFEERHFTAGYHFEEDIKWVEKAYSEAFPVHERILKTKEQLKDLEEMENYFKYLKDSDTDLSVLTQLKFFVYKIGVLSRENRIRLRQNYENIAAVVFRIGSSRQGDVYLAICPAELEIETDRILRTLNFFRLEIPDEFLGTYRHVSETIRGRRQDLKARLEEYRKDLHRLKEQMGEKLAAIYSRMAVEQEINRIKKELACSGGYFYLSGWVPAGDTEYVRDTLEKGRDKVQIMFKKASEVYEYLVPPTKLKNSRLLKPFEALVKMYGVPGYYEADPTAFLGITYMVLFGAMFGDLGQGFVLMLAGVLAGKRNDRGLAAGILTRIGFSSSVFGLLYGSVFGFEDVFPAFLVRPITDINSMLVGSVVLGVALLITSFGYGIWNALNRGDLKEGLFGENGLAGLLFYLALLALALNTAAGKRLMPNSAIFFALALFAALIVTREPLAYHLPIRPGGSGGTAGYYLESGFGMLETLLSMVSGTISFVRVGAFAISHAGLSMAVETMAGMTGSAAGGVLVHIVGNAVIIGLEGLIVFIQGLRLEYYEMFGKYYRGEGVEFQPAGIRRNGTKLIGGVKG